MDVRGWGRRGGELVFDGDRLSFWEDERVLWKDGEDGFTTMYIIT